MKKLIILLTLFSASYLQAKDTAFGTVMQPLDTTKFLGTIEGHMASIREENLAKAYYNYTSLLFRHYTSFVDFQELIKKFAPLNKNKYLELHTIYYVEELGYYNGRACSHENETVGIEYEMVFEKGIWKINSFNLRNIL